MKLTFFVKGSASSPYEVSFDSDAMTFRCSCQAGVLGNECKHRTGLILGNCPGYLPNGSAPIEELGNYLEGSRIMDSYLEIEALSQQIAEMNKKLKSLKKQFGRLMNE